MKNNFKFERKPSGVFIVNDKEVAHTIQCGHCGCHFISIRGSGKIRGFCMKCMKTTCGKIKCDVCIPYEYKLDKIDGG